MFAIKLLRCHQIFRSIACGRIGLKAEPKTNIKDTSAKLTPEDVCSGASRGKNIAMIIENKTAECGQTAG